MHIKNIDGELDEFRTTEDYSVVRNEGNRQVSRKVHPFSDGNKRIGSFLFLPTYWLHKFIFT